METVGVSTAPTLLFSMPQATAVLEVKEHTAAADAAGVASSEAASFTAPSLFSTPVSVIEVPASSSEPSPAAPPQEMQPSPSPMLEQRTIFVAGFPLDMTEREFHCLLTFLPGYEACQLSWGTGAPQGFALFRTNSEANTAVERLAGHQVEVGSVLRAELAHKNLVIKVGICVCTAPQQSKLGWSPLSMLAAALLTVLNLQEYCNEIKV